MNLTDCICWVWLAVRQHTVIALAPRGIGVTVHNRKVMGSKARGGRSTKAAARSVHHHPTWCADQVTCGAGGRCGAERVADRKVTLQYTFGYQTGPAAPPSIPPTHDAARSPTSTSKHRQYTLLTKLYARLLSLPSTMTFLCISQVWLRNEMVRWWGGMCGVWRMAAVRHGLKLEQDTGSATCRSGHRWCNQSV
ncbi:hypothetical protein E2C01_009931 [Portunus trituberculatus]|uniref:Secreted protein n=1 Tax=Portunus trituberculatus TaxID=210409 RepID=A0A5B7D7C6_PORTR|nr:hypothetical protein [Portunus trituberculatus]